MKKLILAAALLIASIIVLPASPASAETLAFKEVTCVYTGGANQNPVYGNIKVEPDAYGAFSVTGKINDSANRTWKWTLYHNGYWSFRDLALGDTTIVQRMTDLNGVDSIRWHFENPASTVNCDATVNV